MSAPPKLSDRPSSGGSEESSPPSSSSEGAKFTATMPTGCIRHMMDYIPDRKTWNRVSYLSKDVREACKDAVPPLGNFKVPQEHSYGKLALSSDKRFLLSLSKCQDAQSPPSYKQIKVHSFDLRAGTPALTSAPILLASNHFCKLSRDGRFVACRCFFAAQRMRIYKTDSILSTETGGDTATAAESSETPLAYFDLTPPLELEATKVECYEFSANSDFFAVIYAEALMEDEHKHIAAVWNLKDGGQLIKSFEVSELGDRIPVCFCSNDSMLWQFKDERPLSLWNWTTDTYVEEELTSPATGTVKRVTRMEWNPVDPSVVCMLVSLAGVDRLVYSFNYLVDIYRLTHGTDGTPSLTYLKTLRQIQFRIVNHYPIYFQWFPCGTYLAINELNGQRLELLAVATENSRRSSCMPSDNDNDDNDLPHRLVDKANQYLNAKNREGFFLWFFFDILGGRSMSVMPLGLKHGTQILSV